jgi:hypothetical protein
MTKFKVLALTASLIMATAGLAIACDKGAKSASAETAKAEMAQASGCASGAAAETAAAKTASAEGCSKSESAAVKTAGAGCASGAAAETAAAKTASAEGCSKTQSAAVKTAGAGCASSTAVKTAGAGCSSNATAQTVRLETVRMPSGAMAVFYHGTNPEAVAYLQSKADAGCGGFVCDMAKSMAADQHVSTEMAKTETGVMILVTSSDKQVVDGYEAQYAALSSTDAQQGE